MCFGAARFKPEGAEGEDLKQEAIGGGGAILRCLRLLAVQWAAR